MRKVIFFVNPLLVSQRSRRAIVEQCAALLRDEGCVVEIQDVVFDGSAGERARRAVESGFDTVFVCGGDGTVFHVLQGVAGTDAGIGVIPFGTGNVLAQNLRLPRNPLAAFELQRKADAISIQLGEVISGGRNWFFLLAAGVGIHAAVMGLAANGAGKRMWGRAAYYAGGVCLLLRHPIRPVDVEVMDASGDVKRFRASEVLAVRAPKIGLWRAGGDLRATTLRMAAVPHTSRAGLMHACFHAVFTRRSDRQSENRTGFCYPRYEDSIEIACTGAGRAPLPVEADGEVIGAGSATFKMSERRLRLLWPSARGR